MAGSSVIGALRVVLGADTAALDKGLKQSQAGLADFGSSVGLGMAALAASVAAASYSIIGSVKSVINSADQLNSLSQSVGVNVEELSKLGYAASLSGVGIEQFGGALGKLTKAMNSAVTDGAGPAAQAFAALGVSVRNQDGTLKSSGDVLSEIAERFSSYRDGAAKTALAIAIFGDAGARLIPMLNQGRDGLSAIGKEAESFGLVLDKRTTMAAAAFHQNLVRLDAINLGLYTTIAAKLLPSLEALSSQYLESSKSSDLFSRAAGRIVDIINAVIREVMIGVVEINAMITQFSNLGSALAQIFNAPKADWAKIWGDYKAANEAVAASAQNAGASIKAATNAGDSAGGAVDWLMQAQAIKATNREVVAYADSWRAAAPTIAAATSGALQTFLDGQAKRAAAQNAEAEMIGKSAGEQAKLRLEYEAQAIALAKNIPLTAALNMQVAAAGQAASQASLNLQAANIAQQVMSPAERYAQDLANLKIVYDNTSMTAETFAARQRQLAEGIGATWEQVGSQVMGSFSQLASAFAKNNKTMGIAAKAFGIAQAIINTQLAVTKALATYGPTPMGYLAVAGAVAQGAASVATITAQGFATGGLVNGPGTSVSDSIPAMLSNGEFVMNAEATRRNLPDLQAMNSGQGSASAGPARNIILQGFSWSREQMAPLFEFINEGLADDHKFNFKFA